ncbi:MAG: RNA methyltransferase [Ignavibacteria bacterium CG22_combo_CG10-13_8_21_14_all_37_15]|nr:MAG: RNA methyltransferase [Ignavibacteria bacterium CG22_combo_CG10-13_8_21_14_all_37_15]
MTIFEQTNKILINCPLRAVPFLKGEVLSLGFPIVAESLTHVEITGTMADTMLLNLSLRTAHRVLFYLDEFYAETPDELYRNFKKIRWEDYLSEKGYISVSSAVDHPMVNDSRFPNLKCKDAIVDRLRDIYGLRPDSGSERRGAMIYFYWKDNHCTVFFDTSGVTLAKRNYRKMPFLAPMQESLAATTLLAANWKGEGNFVNPMCGSGTLAIEAALIALHKAPGLFKDNFAFMHLKGYDDSIWQKIRSEIKNESVKSFNGRILATDISEEAIFASKQNAKTAGVDHLIEFAQCDFRETEIPEGGGIVFLNPEYGERLGEELKLESVYKAIGDFFKQKCQGYTGYIFTGNFSLAKKIGLRTKRKIPLFNGSIDCRLLEFELYSGTKKIFDNDPL